MNKQDQINQLDRSKNKLYSLSLNLADALKEIEKSVQIANENVIGVEAKNVTDLRDLISDLKSRIDNIYIPGIHNDIKKLNIEINAEVQ